MKNIFWISQNIIIFGLLMLNTKLSLCCTPTIFPAEPFDDDVALATANALYSLYSTEGTKSDILEIITSCTFEQRKIIENKYNTLHRGRNLADDVAGKYSPGHLVKSLFAPLAELFADVLCLSMELDTDEMKLITALVLLSKSVQLKNDTRKYYQEMFNNDLLQNVESDTSGHFRDALMFILKNDRKPDTKKVDTELAKTLADTLRNAPEKGDDGINDIITILFETPFNVLKEVVKHFKEKYNEDLHEFLDEKYEDDLGETFRQGACLAYDEGLHSSILLRRAMKGPGTREENVQLLVFTELETCLQDVKNKFYEIYKITLLERMTDDFSYEEMEVYTKLLGPDQPKPVNLWNIPVVKRAGGR